MVVLCLAFSKLTLFCHSKLTCFFLGFYDPLSKVCALSLSCILLPYDPYYNSHLSYLRAWSLALSPARYKLLREGDRFGLFMFVSSVPKRVPGP